MKRLPITRDVVFLVLLFTVLAGLTAYATARRVQAEEAAAGSRVPYSSHSATGNGMLALHNWLAAIGYRPQRIENRAFRVQDDVVLLFVVEPSEDITRDEALYLLNWVARGHTLYVAETGFGSGNALLAQLDVSLAARGGEQNGLRLTQPFVDASMGTLDGESLRGLATNRDDSLAYDNGKPPTLLRIAHGEGTLWLSSAPSLLSNENLANENNAKFVLGLVQTAPRGSVIAIDEYHHGLNETGEETFLAAMYVSPWGWALLFSILLVFGYLVVNGKRFGRTIPVQRALARRTPSEYVVSMANLFRRANKRGMVLQHYRHALKRRLGRPFHLSPELPDERYVELLTRMRPELDRVELTRVLDDLRRADANELDLVKSVERAVAYARPRSRENK
jgi:hypothetical protein